MAWLIFWRLSQSFRNRRSATKACDYVVAIWLLWKKYVVPSSWLQMTATDLLEDALFQLHSRGLVFLPSLSPAGLLGRLERTASWDLTSCSRYSQIGDSTNIYGALAWLAPLVVGSFPQIHLMTLPDAVDSLANHGESFFDSTATFNVAAVMVAFMECFSDWDAAQQLSVTRSANKTSRSAAISPIHSKLTPSEQASFIREVKQMLLSVPKEATSHVALFASLSKEIRVDFFSISLEDLQDGLYAIVCEVVCLDHRYLQANNVEMIFSRWQGHKVQEEGALIPASGTCVGLINRPLWTKARSGKKELKTIALPDQPHTPLYEAVKVQDPSPPEYVIGVWLQLHMDIKIDQVGAVMVKGGDEYNAYIV